LIQTLLLPFVTTPGPCGMGPAGCGQTCVSVMPAMPLMADAENAAAAALIACVYAVRAAGSPPGTAATETQVAVRAALVDIRLAKPLEMVAGAPGAPFAAALAASWVSPALTFTSLTGVVMGSSDAASMSSFIVFRALSIPAPIPCGSPRQAGMKPMMTSLLPAPGASGVATCVAGSASRAAGGIKARSFARRACGRCQGLQSLAGLTHKPPPGGVGRASHQGLKALATVVRPTGELLHARAGLNTRLVNPRPPR